MGEVAIRVPHMPDEHPTSYMSRLAACNGVSLVQLAGDMSLSPSSVAAGTGPALAELARLGGIDETALRAAGLAKVEGVLTLAGETLSRNCVRQHRMHVCARCLLEDAGPSASPEELMYGRTVWLIEQVRTCAKHGIALVPAAEPPRHPVAAWDFTSRVQPLLADLPRIAGDVPIRVQSRLERYLLGRLGGARDGGWLDGLPFHEAAETCEWVGAVALYGPRVSSVRLSDEERHCAGDAGYEIASDGEAGFAAFSDGMRKATIAAKANTDGQKVFGHFWFFLQRCEEAGGFAPVRRIMKDLMAAAKPVASGETILGMPVESRIVHSIRTISVETGLHPKTVRALLKREGIIGADHQAGSDGLVTIEADQLAGVMHRLQHSLSYKQAMEYINASRTPAWEIYRAGFVKPHTRMNSGSHNKKFYLEFAQEELDEFLKALLDGAEPRELARDGEVGIQRAGLQNCCSIAEVVQLIIDKRLPWVGRLQDERGFASVLVRHADVAPLVRGAEPEGLTEGRVRHRLRSDHRAVPALIEDGLLASFESRHPRTRAAQRYVTFASLDRFERDYVTLSTRASEIGSNHTMVRARLMKRGIEPALDAKRYFSPFYRRSDLPSGL